MHRTVSKLLEAQRKNAGVPTLDRFHDVGRTLADERTVFRFKHPACPHCSGVLHAQVTGLTLKKDGTGDVTSVDLRCESKACDGQVRSTDTQSLWQPIIDQVIRTINSRYYFIS